MFIHHSRFSVAWLVYSQPPNTLYNRTVSLPQLDYTHFSIEKDFRRSFCKNHYDAVLCSCESSRDDGPQIIIQWIRSVRCSQIPLMILADNVDESSLAEALYIGADDVQQSAIFPSILNARVAGLCARSKAHQSHGLSETGKHKPDT